VEVGRIEMRPVARLRDRKPLVDRADMTSPFFAPLDLRPRRACGLSRVRFNGRPKGAQAAYVRRHRLTQPEQESTQIRSGFRLFCQSGC
jgi:hypothetical protein